MILDSLFPPVEFTNAELVEIAEAMNKPAVKKYLKNEIATSFKAIADGQPQKGETAEEYLRRQATVTGGCAVLEALFQIEKPGTAS